jgi:hypothetical protein
LNLDRTVLGWINDGTTLREIIERMDKPEPEGFGIKTNLGTLSRMVGLWRSEQLLKARPEEAERARALLKSEADSIAFQKATIAVLQQRLFESAVESRDGREQRETLRMLLEHEIKIRKLDLAEKKLEESMRQFEFNAARLAMKYWHEFREIDEMAGPDEEEKIWMARDVMFVGPNGESPVRPRIAGGITNDKGANDKAESSSIGPLPLTPDPNGFPSPPQVGGPNMPFANAKCGPARGEGNRVEVMHKLSSPEGEKSFNDGVKIEHHGKFSEPPKGGTTCGGEVEPAEAGTTCGEMTNDNGTNDKGNPITNRKAAPTRRRGRKSEREF